MTTYVPGFSEVALAFMRVRSGASHASFMLPHLASGNSLLDCGCGPGTITVDLAAVVIPGSVIAIDQADEQLASARELADERGLHNITFQQAEVYDLPFEDDSFDRVFSNALLEHLTDPTSALKEIHRVMRPGGIIGVSIPDWGGLVLGPTDSGIAEVAERYRQLQAERGGSMYRGRDLAATFRDAGFADPVMSARSEVFDPKLVGNLLAEVLEDVDLAAADTARNWIEHPDAFFAQIWVETIARA